MKWTPVSEAMPAIDQRVLAYVPSLDDMTVLQCYDDGNGKPVFPHGHGSGQPFEVTHWAAIFRPKLARRAEFVVSGEIKEGIATGSCRHKITKADLHSGDSVRCCEKCGIVAHSDGRFDYFCGAEYCRCSQ